MNCLNARDLLIALWTVEQHIVPESWVEVLQSPELQPFGVHRGLDGLELIPRPGSVLAGGSPARTVALRLRNSRTAGEVVGQMSDDVSRPGLPGEAEILGSEHLAVESEAELHRVPFLSVHGMS